MDNRIPPYRPDVVVSAQSVPRPTPKPPRVDFSQVLARGASGIVAGAEAALTMLPGGPLVAVALRGAGGTPMSTPMSAQGNVGVGGASSSSAPEGPGVSGTATGTNTGTAGTPTDGGIQSTLQQSQEMNMYYLQIQEQVNAQNRTYSALTNVLKAEHDTVKTAIGNIH
jgi:hypothetical protein